MKKEVLLIIFVFLLLFITSCQYYPKITGKQIQIIELTTYELNTDKLILHWNFDQQGSILDQSGNNYNGQITGNPTWSLDTYSNNGYSLSFDGVDDFAEFSPSYYFIQDGTDFTMMGWYKTSNFNNNYFLAIRNTHYNFFLYSYLGFGPSQFNPNQITSHVEVTGPGDWPKMNSYLLNSYNNEGWNQYAIVFKNATSTENSTLKVYLNGQLVDTVTNNNLLRGSHKAWSFGIGANYPTNQKPYKGLVDDVYLFKRALNENEINSYYNNILNPSQEVLYPTETEETPLTTPIEILNETTEIPQEEITQPEETIPTEPTTPQETLTQEQKEKIEEDKRLKYLKSIGESPKIDLTIDFKKNIQVILTTIKTVISQITSSFKIEFPHKIKYKNQIFANDFIEDNYNIINKENIFIPDTKIQIKDYLVIDNVKIPLYKEKIDKILIKKETKIGEKHGKLIYGFKNYDIKDKNIQLIWEIKIPENFYKINNFNLGNKFDDNSIIYNLYGEKSYYISFNDVKNNFNEIFSSYNPETRILTVYSKTKIIEVDEELILDPEWGLLDEVAYYVDKDSIGGTCNNNNQGTINQPWCTIQYAVSSNSPVQAGDTINVRAGVYRESITLGKSGTENAYITLTNYLNDNVIVDGSIEVTGFTLVSGNTYSKSYGSDPIGLFVDDILIEKVWPFPQNLQGFGNNLDNYLYENQWTYGNGQIYIKLNNNPSNHKIEVPSIDRGINLNEKNFWIINGFKITKHKKQGIYVTGTSLDCEQDYLIIKNNVIEYNDMEGITIYWCPGVIIDNNIIQKNGLKRGEKGYYRHLGVKVGEIWENLPGTSIYKVSKGNDCGDLCNAGPELLYVDNVEWPYNYSIANSHTPNVAFDITEIPVGQWVMGYHVDGSDKNDTIFIHFSSGDNPQNHRIKRVVDVGDGHGIIIRGENMVGRFTIKNNQILNNNAKGISICTLVVCTFSVEGSVVYNNNVFNSGESGIDLAGTEGLTVSYNNLWQNGIRDTEDNEISGHGDKGMLSYYSNRIHHNVIHGSGRVEMGIGYHNGRLFHNNFVKDIHPVDQTIDCSGFGADVSYTQPKDYTDMALKNNIFTVNREEGNYVVCGYRALIDSDNQGGNLGDNFDWNGNDYYTIDLNKRHTFRDGGSLLCLTGTQQGDDCANNNFVDRYPNEHLTDGLFDSFAVDPLFVDQDNNNLQLQSNSPMIDNGVPLTYTSDSGVNTQTVNVLDSLYFHDIGDYPYLPVNEKIKINNQLCTIIDVDYSLNKITCSEQISYNNNDKVYWNYEGEKPDIGAFEYTTTSVEICDNNIDDDLDNLIDCQDSDCYGQIGPNGANCCNNPSTDCIQDDCIIESCGLDNECEYTNRNLCDNTECTSSFYCDSTLDCRDPNENSQLGENICESCLQAQHNFNELWSFEDLTTPYCCDNDANEFYINNGINAISAEACCDNVLENCVDSNGICQDEYPIEVTCDDNIDNDCDSHIDLEDSDCGASCSDGEQRDCPLQNGVCYGSYEICTNNLWFGCNSNTYINYNSSYQETESNCIDLLDNDCDSYIDCNDQDCVSNAICQNQGPSPGGGGGGGGSSSNLGSSSSSNQQPGSQGSEQEGIQTSYEETSLPLYIDFSNLNLIEIQLEKKSYIIKTDENNYSLNIKEILQNSVTFEIESQEFILNINDKEEFNLDNNKILYISLLGIDNNKANFKFEIKERGISLTEETPKKVRKGDLITKSNILYLLLIIFIILLILLVFYLIKKPKNPKYNKKVIKFIINNALKKGYSKEEIKNKFLESGWPKKLIDKFLK